MDEHNFYESMKYAMTGLLGGGLSLLGFTSKYQTKSGCKKAHVAYDRYIESKFESIEIQQTNTHEVVTDIKAMVKQMRDDVYVVRGSD